MSPSRDGFANAERPRLRWIPFAGAAEYRLGIWADPGRSVLLTETRTTATEYECPVTLADGVACYTELAALDAAGATIAIDRARFRVRKSPAWLPRLDLVVHDTARSYGGYRLFNIFDYFTYKPAERVACLVVVNSVGEYVWWYRAEDASDLLAALPLPNGNLAYVHRVQTPDFKVMSKAVEMTWDGQIVWETPDDMLVHHDIRPGPLGAYLALTWTWQKNSRWAYEGDKLELLDPKTGQSIWTWNLFDHFDPQQYPTPEMDDLGRSFRGTDWSHANGAVWDERRGLIWLCARNMDSLIGIEFPSGQVRTIIGRHGIGGPDLINHSHAPEIQSDGSILLFDNGNTRATPRSRVVRIAFDELLGTATEEFVWVDDPPFFDASMGDADMLPNGNILVTAGQSARIIELSPSGEKVWELRIDQTEKPRWTYRTVQLQSLPEALRAFDDS